jgi:protein-L-isoaspartate(D-aspartate) O-methyltransferase
MVPGVCEDPVKTERRVREPCCGMRLLPTARSGTRHASGEVPDERGTDQLLEALHAEGIEDPRILEAFRRVRREDFVPGDRVWEAARDRPIPIPHGQVTTQPSLIARMLDGLGLTGSERVLEVGTGYGFQTGLLAALAREVFSVERFPDLARAAEANLAAAGLDATVVFGDGTLGLIEHAPFDAVIVSAASPRVPQPLVQQLAIGGRLVHPVGPGGREMVVAFRKEGDHLVEERRLVPAHFVRLVGEHGLPDE